MKRLTQCIAATVAALIVLSPAIADAKGGGFSGGGGFSRGGGFSGSSRPSFSSPSKPSFSTPSRPSSSAPKPPSITTSKPSAPSATNKPKTSYDQGATRAQRQEQSRETYRSQQGPKPRDMNVKTETYTSKKPSASAMPKNYSSKQWRTRDSRAHERFGGHYGTYAPPVVYNDGFNPWFWMWLMSEVNRGDRDRFIYNHRDNIDPARLEELKKQDADLDKRLKALENSGVKKDPTYVPKDLEKDADLIYADTVAAEKAKESAGVLTYVWVSALILLIGGALWYLFFMHKFTVRRRPA